MRPPIVDPDPILVARDAREATRTAAEAAIARKPGFVAATSPTCSTLPRWFGPADDADDGARDRVVGS